MIRDIQSVTLASVTRRSTDSLTLLQGFADKQANRRLEWAQSVQRTIDSWYFGFGSPAVAGFLETYAEDRNGSTVDTSMHPNIQAQIADLVRMSQTCPFEDVRLACSSILEDLSTKKRFNINIPLHRSPSYCYTADELPHLECIFEKPTEDDPLFSNYALFGEHWHLWARIDNFTQVLGGHPEFFESFFKYHRLLFFGDLSIPYFERYYLAVLAAAEMRCPQLVCLFARYFLQYNGCPTWLQSLSEGPQKWRQLQLLNPVIAHTPWKFTADDIHRLTRGVVGDRCEKPSMAQLMHAVAIMTHVHALACFVYAAGARPELENLQHATAANAAFHAPPTPSFASPQAPMGAYATSGDDGPDADHPSRDPEQLVALLRAEPNDEWENNTGDADANIELFTSLTKSNCHLSLADSCAPVHLPKDFCVHSHPDVRHFLSSPEMTYVDFDDPPFLMGEYSWNEHGTDLADFVATPLGTFLDDVFQMSYFLTYNTLNTISDVNTSRYRHTIWFYVQSLFGVCNEEFRFDQVAKFVSFEQRSFLKTCATRPFDLCAFDHHASRAVFGALNPSELIHVLIIMMEARHQSCISYVLRAISQFHARS